MRVTESTLGTPNFRSFVQNASKWCLTSESYSRSGLVRRKKHFAENFFRGGGHIWAKISYFEVYAIRRNAFRDPRVQIGNSKPLPFCLEGPKLFSGQPKLKESENQPWRILVCWKSIFLNVFKSLFCFTGLASLLCTSKIIFVFHHKIQRGMI